MKLAEEKKYITVEQKILIKMRYLFLLIIPVSFIAFALLNIFLAVNKYKASVKDAFISYDAYRIKESVENAKNRAVEGYISFDKQKLEEIRAKNPNKTYKDLDYEKLKKKYEESLDLKDIRPSGEYNDLRFNDVQNEQIKKMYEDINFSSVLFGTIHKNEYMIGGKKTDIMKFVSDYERNEYGHRVYQTKRVKDKSGNYVSVPVVDKNGHRIYNIINPLESTRFDYFTYFLLEFIMLNTMLYSIFLRRPKFYTYHGTAKWAESFDLIFSHDSKKIYEIDLINVDDGVILGRFDAPFQEYAYFERKNTVSGILNLKQKYEKKFKDKKLAEKKLKDFEKSKLNVDFHKLIPLIPETSSGQKVIKKHFERIWRPEQILLKDDSKTHVIVAAPTRTGKGVSIITPTLLEWKQSVFVLDIKGENYQNTAYCRRNRWNNIIIRFSPKSDNSSAFNPLGEIRMLTGKEAEDIANIANILTTKEKPDPFWDTASSSLIRSSITRNIYETFFNNPLFEDIKGNRIPREKITDETLCTLYFPVVQGNLGAVFDYLVSQSSLPRIAQLKYQSTVEDFFSFCKDEDLVRMVQNKLCTIYPNFRQLIMGGEPMATKEEALKKSGIGNLPGMDDSKMELPEIHNFTKMDYTKLNPDGSFEAENIPHQIKWHTGRKHPEVVAGFTDSTQASENTTSTIIKVATTCIQLFSLPTVRKNTSTSDFRIRDIMFYKQPMSLYLVVLPADILDVAPLVRILIVQMVNMLTPEQDYRNEVKPPHKLLMLLDEFPAIGKIEVLETAAGFVAGKTINPAFYSNVESA